MDVPTTPQKSDFLYTNSLPNFPPIIIPFSKEKHPILTKLNVFYHNLLKIHPIYVFWAPLSLMKPSIDIPNLAKKVPQKAGTYMYYHVNVRTSPPSGLKTS